MMTPEQKAQIKACICKSPLAGFIGNLLTPVRVMSGGLLPRVCPSPNDPRPGDLAKPADSAEGAAARIKKMEAEAKARRAAVRYLGTVDCSRFPEAEGALIAGLRADTNECVRFEAALALGNGCCCTKKILAALTDTVNCKKTNDPAETSPRVRAAAAIALERCLARMCEVEDEPRPPEKPVVEPKRETPPEPGRAAPPLPPPELPVPGRIEARRALERYRRETAPRPVQSAEPALLPPARRQAAAIAQMTRITPPPEAVAAKPVPVPSPAPRQGPVAPPSGRRDVWSLLMHSVR